uniref:sulfotransferase domain-containing protein n=1 Tax=Parerythrobacter lutipelagi TaxID=1964208 RepID=UPI0010F4E718|nr:sulfotransferase domain-containing protein [Parerythrobacter lutipelagi]
MASVSDRDELFRSSVVVTGTHYSMTTLVGRILGASPDFHLVHEPTNASPTLSYDSIRPDGWYRFYDGAEYEELRGFLIRIMRGEGIAGSAARRISEARTSKECLQVARYLQRKLPMRLSRKRAVFKDPFLLFSARNLQRQDGLKVILTVRHPAAFAESFMRAGNGFDFTDLVQPPLLAAVPELACDLRQAAASPPPIIVQAGLLWRAVYGFADAYLRDDPRTLVLVQDELIADIPGTLSRLFEFAGARQNSSTAKLVAKAFGGTGRDFAGTGSYITRNPSGILGKWKSRLSADDIAHLRAATGDLAERYGYDRSSWEH